MINNKFSVLDCGTTPTLNKIQQTIDKHPLFCCRTDTGYFPLIVLTIARPVIATCLKPEIVAEHIAHCVIMEDVKNDLDQLYPTTEINIKNVCRDLMILRNNTLL